MSRAPTVVKIGGTTLEDPKTSPLLWDALAALAKSRPTIIIHGGGKAVDRLLERLGMTVERRQGLRVTPAEQMPYITGVLAGSLNKSIVADLLKRGVWATGLCLGDGGAIPVSRKAVEGIDLGFVGDVTTTERQGAGKGVLDVLLTAGYTPVLSSIGIDEAGVQLNINADDAAAGIAWHARAGTLVLMTDVPGILDGSKRVIPSIDHAGVEKLITDGVINGGMIPKARAAVAAARLTGSPVIILSGNDPASLGHWTAGKPAGTTVLANA